MQDGSTSYKRILMNFWRVGRDPRRKGLDFGGDLDFSVDIWSPVIRNSLSLEMGH